jgi:hypothetical protein
MSLDRDIQSKLISLEFDDVEVHKTGEDNISWSRAIDTLGYRNIYCTFEMNEPGLGANVCNIVARESIDAITWVDASYKLLPTRTSTITGQLVITPIAPYIQTVGLQSSHRYVQFGIIAIVLGLDETVEGYFNVSMEKELQEATDYDPRIVSISHDGLA